MSVILPGQTFSYAENQQAGSVIATVEATAPATNPSAIATGFRFAGTGTSTSADGFFQINNLGEISITAAGVAAGVAQNDFETGLNSFNYAIQATSDDISWGIAEIISLNVTDIDDNAPVIDPDQLKFIVDLGTFTEKVPTNLFNLIIDLGYSNVVDAGQNELQFLSTRFATQQEANAVLQRAIGLGLTDPRPQLIGEYEGRRLNSEQMQQLSLKLQQQDPNSRPTEPIQW